MSNLIILIFLPLELELVDNWTKFVLPIIAFYMSKLYFGTFLLNIKLDQVRLFN